MRGPSRFRFGFSHGAVPSGASYPTPDGRYTLYRNGDRVTANAEDSWTNPGGGTTYEVGLPEGDLELVFDLTDKVTTQAIPVRLDSVAVLPVTGDSFAQWAKSLLLTAGDRNMDNDGDKRTNFFEYAYGTYPYRKDERSNILTIDPPDAAHPARLVLKWLPGRIDATWAIQESDDMISWHDRWVPHSSQSLPAEEGFMIQRWDVAVENTKRWFRTIARATVP